MLRQLFEFLKLVLVLALAGMLAACGGGSSAATSLGGGQDPDPTVQDFAIAYIKRPVLLDANGNLLTSAVRDAADFRPGAELLIRDRASPSAAERSLTADVFPPDADGNASLYDVKDLSVSFDGARLVFAMRAPEDPALADDEQPTWNIWLYDYETSELRRVMQSDFDAKRGQDVAPHFLPDGRIVFSSTRQRQAQAVLLDENKAQFSALDEDGGDEAFALHVMDDQANVIEQITFNQSSDLDPAVLSDGRVVYSRWDNVANISRFSLYTASPDGRNMQVLYGVHSHDTGPDGAAVEFTKPMELPDGRLLTLLRPPGNQSRGSTIPVAIDTAAYVEHDQTTFDNQGLLADAQEVLIPGDLNLDDGTPALQGRYASVAPLFDGTSRLLVSWSQCRLVDTTSDPADPVIVPCLDQYLQNPNYVEADPLFGVWMFDPIEQTQQPIVVANEGEVYSEVVVMEPRVNPPVILDGVPGLDLDPDLAGERLGIVHIRSVYDVDGTEVAPIEVLRDPGQTLAADRPIRFVRLVKAVSLPDPDIVMLDGTAFGASQAQLMREIIGYGEVHPDGSVKMQVPANVAFWFDFLDVNGRRVGPRHNNWLQVRPGEVQECTGCHTPTSELPHGRMDAQAPSANPGAPSDGAEFPSTDPALFADLGETMAEVYARFFGAPRPNFDLLYQDVWTDDVNVRPKDPDISYPYALLTTGAPLDPDPECATTWSPACRIVINYEEHIHPLWNVDRRKVDIDGNPFDDTCTSCHTSKDAVGADREPDAQLDLTDGPSDQEPAHFKSYRELLFSDVVQELDGQTLVNVQEQARDANGNLLFLLAANGDQVLDANGDPIPVMVDVLVGPSLSVAGANASPRFFDLFAVPNGSHQGRLSDSELKLISEWIDIGGQYYNNPFDVPQ